MRLVPVAAPASLALAAVIVWAMVQAALVSPSCGRVSTRLTHAGPGSRS